MSAPIENERRAFVHSEFRFNPGSRILALQLKRIGDLVLTTAALRALRAHFPKAHIGLGVMDGNASLLPAIKEADSAVVFGRGRGFAPWQQMLTGEWSTVLDFSGTDRSALATVLSRSAHRVTFEWARKSWMRSVAYSAFVYSAVRERHTAEHYLDLVQGICTPRETDGPPSPLPGLDLPQTAQEQTRELLRKAGVEGDFALIHPGTAREDKYWMAVRWAEVVDRLQGRLGLRCVLSGGNEAFEQAHLAAIQAGADPAPVNLAGKTDLLGLAALAAQARVVVSCDTGVVHLASAFRTPQVVLYGPINPFHWRPQHERTVVISAAQPDSPLTQYEPRMKGAAMERISTGVVIRATEEILAAP